MDDTAERILKFAGRELGSVPENEQETTLREVMNELTTWMQAIKAGKDWETAFISVRRASTHAGFESTRP
jgi:DNA-binding ferritin-like protein